MIARHFRKLALRVVILCACSALLLSTEVLAQQPVTSVSSNIITTTMPSGVTIVEDILAGSCKIMLPDGSYLLRSSKTAQWMYFDCKGNLRRTSLWQSIRQRNDSIRRPCNWEDNQVWTRLSELT